jgi:mannose-1-phosphate guanylyltransferase
VVVAPSDHYLARPAALRAAIAAAAVEASRVSLTLVGVEADRAEIEYGWIEPGGIKSGRVRRIVRFVEKPSPARARELFERGCLWNTFVMVAEGARIWRIAEEKMPVQAAVIRACVAANASKGTCLDRAYADMESANFSHAVLEQLADLGVVSARACGFSDWGSPDRVFASLKGTADHERLLARIGSRESNRAGHISQSPGMTTLLSRSDRNASASQQKGSQS